jgi:hypothetical protein
VWVSRTGHDGGARLRDRITAVQLLHCDFLPYATFCDTKELIGVCDGLRNVIVEYFPFRASPWWQQALTMKNVFVLDLLE